MVNDSITLIHGDCMEEMKRIPAESVDMILCDLPYGITNSPFDKRLPFDELWAQYNRIIKPRGCIALFGQGKFYVELVYSNLKMYRDELVWDKVLTSGFLNAKRMPLRRHEKIALFYKRQPVFNPQFTVGMPLHSKGREYINKPVVNRNYGKYIPFPDDSRAGATKKYPTTILQFQKPHPSVALHPTEKPVALCRWLVETYTERGGVVLDNCMGAGSTGVACVMSGRRFIGIELCEEYFNIAQQRVNEARSLG